MISFAPGRVLVLLAAVAVASVGGGLLDAVLWLIAGLFVVVLVGYPLLWIARFLLA